MWTVNRYAYFFRPLAEMRSGATGVFGIFPITNEFFQDLRRKKPEKYLPKYSDWIAGFSINDATKYAEERDIGLNNYYTPPEKIPTYSCHDVSVTNVLQTSTVQYHFYLRESFAGRTKYISVKWSVKNPWYYGNPYCNPDSKDLFLMRKNRKLLSIGKIKLTMHCQNQRMNN